MSEELEEVGIDPERTPVDRLPDHGAWAILNGWAEQNGESYE
jgi:hypothetical protein